MGTSYLSKCQVIIPFVNDAKLVVSPRQWGSEANALCGLHDFSDMGFLLHFLRPNDLFCDVGANIGEYTILASAAIGSHSISFEPVSSTYIELMRNIAVNQVTSLVDARQMAVGSKPGSVMLSTDQDTQNHVVMGFDGSDACANAFVEAETLDNLLLGNPPQLLKVDVEGWEHEVFQGATNLLHNPQLSALIVELNQSGARYGFSDEAIHRELLGCGFETFRYHPFERKLISLQKKHHSAGNTLYVRNLDIVNERLRTSPSFTVRDMCI
jgi:FkbM family methyltransferase